MALRVAFLSGGVASLLLMIPMPPVLHVLWLLLVTLGVGFWSVYLYRRRTGEYLSVGNGARLGSITGVFCFLVVMVVFTINLLVIASSSEVRQAFLEMLESSAPEAAQLLNSPGGMATLLVGSLFAGFIMLTVASTVGGALGAKVLEKE